MYIKSATVRNRFNIVIICGYYFQYFIKYTCIEVKRMEMIDGIR